MKKYELLCRKLRIPETAHQDLKTALTHYTYTEENTETEKDNTRFVFYGQTVFKAEVAQYLFDWVEGKGTQLQHYWGNLFANKRLEDIFDFYDLSQYIRHGKNFDVLSHRHIFVFGLLGFVKKAADENALKKFIFKHFLDNTIHLMPGALPQKSDYKQQCTFLCKLYFNKTPKIEIQKTEANYTAIIMVKDILLCKVESSSYKYVQKKAWKTALRSMAEEQEQKLLQNPEFITKEQERKEKLAQEKEAQRQANIQANEAKQALRSQISQQKKVAREKAAAERDRNRRDAKQATKERKELAAKQSRLKQMGLENISAAKRRILEDKGILPKKK